VLDAQPIQQYLAGRVGFSPWPVLISVAILEAIAIYCWLLRSDLAARWLFAIQCSKALWIISLLSFQLALPSFWPGQWLDIRFAVVMLLSVFNLCFMAELSQLRGKLRRYTLRILYVITLCSMVMCVLNHWTGFFWTLTPDGRMISGSWRWLETAFSPVANIFALFLGFRWYLGARGLRRRQAAMILLSNLVSWLGPIFAFIDGFSWLAPLPTFFTISSIITASAFARLHTLDLMPHAREVIVDSMVDGMILIDETQLIVTANPVVRHLFPKGSLTAGAHLADLFPLWPDLVRFEASDGPTEIESECPFQANPTIHRIFQTPLKAPSGTFLGRLLLFKDVTRERQQQERVLEQEKIISTLEERQRLGRELHDNGQIWCYLDSQSEAIRIWLQSGNQERAERELDRLISVLRENSFGMRESILSLQSGISNSHLLPDAIEQQLDWYRRNCDLDARLDLDFAFTAQTISLTAQAQLLRIVQEALANIRKHAHATSIRITMSLTPGEFQLSIRDNGCGFDPARASSNGHFGLKTMAERAASIGAVFVVDSEPGQGSCLTLRLSHLGK